MPDHHDALFRRTFSQPEHAASLLRTILPPVLAGAIDWASLRQLPGSSVDEELQSRHADLLFTATLGGQAVLIYLLLEHKSGTDRWTALQLLRYVVRVYDRCLDDNPGVATLPPIVPIVVHHGPQRWTAPGAVLDLIDLASLAPEVRRALAPLQPNLRFLLDDLAAMSESRLEQRRATVLSRLTLLLLQFVRSAEVRDPVELVARWLGLLRALWDDPAGRHALIALFSYLASQLEASRERIVAAAALIHEDAQIMGKTIADQFREEGLKKGMTIAEQYREEGFKRGVSMAEQFREEGMAKGKTTGMAELLLRQLRKRFGNLSETTEAQVRTASSENLDTWAERILTAATIDEIFGK